VDLAELQQRRHNLAREMRELPTTVEQRDNRMRPEERDRFDSLDEQVTDIDRQIRGAAATGGGEDRSRELGGLGPAAGGDARARFVLGAEQRFSDWQAARGGRSDFSTDEARDFSLGRLVQRMAGFGAADSELEQRAQAASADATGGVLVPEPLAAFVIDRIRPSVQVLNAGATVVPMDSDELSIPRIASGVAGTWRAENAAVAEASLAFERVKFVTKTLAVLVRLPYEMFEDMTEAGSRHRDRAQRRTRRAVGLRGSLRLGHRRGASRRAQRDRRRDSVARRERRYADDFDPIVRAVAGVMANSNKAPNATIYSPRTWETLALFKDTTGQPLQRPSLPDGYRELVSSQLPDTLTQGTSSDASEAYTGYYPDLMIGVRPTIGVRIKQLDQTFAGNMQIGLLAWLRADIQLAHPESFVVTTGIRP
jgi:hypothetical protein